MYNLFGSSDSIDCDIMVNVDCIGTVEQAKKKISALELELQPLYKKEVNVNLAITDHGYITEVFKGEVDEANNSILATYTLHPQKHPLMVTEKLQRDPGTKAIRAMRSMLSLLSRTQYRPEIKKALSGSSIDRHLALSQICISHVYDLGRKNTNLTDLYKNLAFQMGQSKLLNEGVEVYTKSSIGENCPSLIPFLERRSGTKPIELDLFKAKWLKSFDPVSIPQFEILKK